MFFHCKNCYKDFEINDEECKGYYNWKCPDCQHIAVKKDMALGLGIIWNCDTGTAKKKSYINTDTPCQAQAGSQCSSCPKA